MAGPIITDPKLIIPTKEDFEKLLTAKLSYEAKQKTPERDAWNKANWSAVPWGISYDVSIGKYNKQMAAHSSSGRGKIPTKKFDIALRYFIVAVVIDWQDLISQLKRTLRNWGFTSNDLQNIAKNVWQPEADYIANLCDSVTVTKLIEKLDVNNFKSLEEAIEKHNSLNNKLFTKDETLKDRVRCKMLEIVDTFLADLENQEIKIKVDDVLFIGSNASYNYTDNSDIDLHIVANTGAVEYPAELGNALYSAYRSIFNNSLDISIYDIPLELFVETENSKRVSNGIYSVKKNKWIKKPVHEDIPEYDKKALAKLVSEWEEKCKKLIDDIEADKLDSEEKVVKMLEEIYEKLRKKGVAKSEYAIENLAFKELRNDGYLDKLKEYKNILVSKRLSLEEKLDTQTRYNLYTKLTMAAGTRPIIQDNGMFFVYNLKASEINSVLSAIRQLHFVAEAHANESEKYDFSNPAELALNNMPKKYYNIRGRLII